MDYEQTSELEIRRGGRFRATPPRGFPRASAPRFPRPWRRPLPRPSPRPRFGAFGVSVPLAASSPFIVSIQSDLAEVLGIGLPLNGLIGAATRRALRMFQSRMGLPVTGDLTGSTLRALRGETARLRAQSFEPPVPEPPEEPGDPAAAEPADSGTEPDGGEPQEEYRITKAGAIGLTRWGTLDLGANSAKKPKQIGALLPARPGIYVIHDQNGAWYAGQAGDIRQRFSSRFSALKDFNLDSSVLTGRSITCYLLPKTLPDIAVFIRPNGLARGQRGDNFKGILTALEDHFIRKLGTNGRGNEKFEGATASAAATLTIQGSDAAPRWEKGLEGSLNLPVR